MGEIDYFMEQIPCLLSCTCFAGAVTVYYKRNFRSDKLPLVFFLILSSISSNRSVESSSRLSFIITFSLCCSIVYNIVKHLKWLNTVRLDFFLAILLTAYDYKFDILTTIGRLIGIPYSVGAQKCTFIMNFVRIMFVVIPQFIRRPSQLKAKLQGLRSKLGPIYIIYCTKFVMEYTYFGTLTLYTMGIFAVVSAVVGGVFLRPDNTAVLEILGFGTKMNQRKYFHGLGMIISFSCIALMMLNELLSFSTYSVSIIKL
ncbi:unnamed protein product [Mytilus coruscus]|uniref:Uncharacterized protein n=1 Tax=Mytilus coruscus TaxID=42192 RepID=A0A6J8CGP1_MYTCO|nr:unnamed protein product [Mytilus coruscus]